MTEGPWLANLNVDPSSCVNRSCSTSRTEPWTVRVGGREFLQPAFAPVRPADIAWIVLARKANCVPVENHVDVPRKGAMIPQPSDSDVAVNIWPGVQQTQTSFSTIAAEPTPIRAAVSWRMTGLSAAGSKANLFIDSRVYVFAEITTPPTIS